MRKITILSILYGSFVYVYLYYRGIGALESFLLLAPMSIIEWFDVRITERNNLKK